MDNQPGTYALILHLPSGRTIEVGRLGAIDFKAGFYTYAGSALGPGGLRGRLSRHLRVQNRPHWHIDYLRMTASLETIWYLPGETRLECGWARTLQQLAGSAPFIGGFGSSDCRCESHLAFFETEPDVAAFQRMWMAADPRWFDVGWSPRPDRSVSPVMGKAR